MYVVCTIRIKIKKEYSVHKNLSRIVETCCREITLMRKRDINLLCSLYNTAVFY